MNDRDGKDESGEESEYHFSDDEGNEELDSPAKNSAPIARASGSGILSRLPNSRRLIISAIVFLLLVIVVYRMVSTSGTTTPAMDISPVNTPMQSASMQAPVTVPIRNPVAVPAQGTIEKLQTSERNVSQQMTNNPANAQSNMPMTMQTAADISKQKADEYAALNAMVDRMSKQLAAIYEEKLSDYATQNKNLQDTVTVLNARVNTVETQLNQLLQALTRQVQNNNAHVIPNTMPSAAAAATPTKVPYTVQAIIPGRAWLRSDSGDTVTVTEGDMLKDVGSITKIDPYDGIVEINTGSKIVSLSYGNET